MPIAFSHISGAEPSTVTFKAATVAITRNSTVMQQEILSLGDPISSGAIAECSSLVPTSTQVGLVTKEAGGILSSVGGVVNVTPNSSLWQVQVTNQSTIVSVANTVTIQGNSTAAVSNLPATMSTAAPATGDTGIIVRQVGFVAYSTTVSVANTVTIQGNSSVVVASGNSSVIVTSGNSSVIVTSGNSSVIITAFPAGNISSVVQTGNSSGLTVRPVWSSSNADQRVQAFVADSTGNLIESSTKASGNSSLRGLIVREAGVDSTYATGVIAATSTADVSVMSSVAAKSIYVYAWSGQIFSTGAGSTFRLMSGSTTVLWQCHSQSLINWSLVVSPPRYLFRTASAANLAVSKGGSSVFGVAYNVSMWQE